MKSMKIDKISSFPFPTSPDKQTILEAENRLVLLGALEVVCDINGKLKKKLFLFNFVFVLL